MLRWSVFASVCVTFINSHNYVCCKHMKQRIFFSVQFLLFCSILLLCLLPCASGVDFLFSRHLKILKATLHCPSAPRGGLSLGTTGRSVPRHYGEVCPSALRGGLSLGTTGRSGHSAIWYCKVCILVRGHHSYPYLLPPPLFHCILPANENPES